MKNVLKYKGFLGSIEVSIEDGIMHGKLLYINDLITYEANTVLDIKAEFEAAVDDYIETCATLNREPKKPFSGTFNVRIGPQLHQLAGEYAAEKGISVNEVVKQSMTSFFSENKQRVAIHKHNHLHLHRGEQVVKEMSYLDQALATIGDPYVFNLQ